MNKIQEFFNEQFGTVRTVIINGKVHFVGVDIARALGYSNASKQFQHTARNLKKK